MIEDGVVGGWVWLEIVLVSNYGTAQGTTYLSLCYCLGFSLRGVTFFLVLFGESESHFFLSLLFFLTVG